MEGDLSALAYSGETGTIVRTEYLDRPMEAREIIADLLAKGMTQAAIAQRTGLGQPTISKVLTGKVADVLSANYRKLQALHNEKKRQRKTAKA